MASPPSPPPPTHPTFEEADAWVWRHADSYTALPHVLNFVHVLTPDEWTRLVFSQWTRFDNIGVYRSELRSLLPTTTVRSVMEADELAAFDALPSVVSVYRGADRHKNVDGLSWSLDRAVAERFPRMLRYYSDQPVLVHGRVHKSHVLAVKLSRNESEIISTKVDPTYIEPLPPRE